MTSATRSSPVRLSPQRYIRQCSTTKSVCRPMHLLMIAGCLLFCAHDNYMSNSNAMIPLCYANPLPTPLILPSSQSASLLSTASDNDGDRLSFDRMAAAAIQTNRVGNLTRQHGGDVFYAFDAPKCDTDTCVGLSSGTADVYTKDATDVIGGKYRKRNDDDCRCQCFPHLNTFREDLNICVDDIHECTLASFVSGSTSEKIPFVFLPLRGQIIHPSKEISFQGIKSPICAVSGAQYLASSGWIELRNSGDLDVPFRLFRDEGRTFLQWLGESDLRLKMQGRLILVHIMCRDMSTIHRSDSMYGASERLALKSTRAAQNLIAPCVAFRVAGMQTKHINNVTEVSFQSESTSSTLPTIDGLTAKDYILIAVCSLILGLIYVASVFLYIHVKRYKMRSIGNANGDDTIQRKSDYQQNDEVTFGNGFSRSSYDRSSGSMVGSGMGDRHTNLNRNISLNGLGNEEQGIIKSNPLLKHYPNLSDNSGFISDMSNSNSECGDDRINPHELAKSISNISYSHASNSLQGRENIENSPQNSTQETECLPQENVSIIEDMTTEDKIENMKAIVNGTMRRKLYFNPAYFEPHLLLSPPPAAIEFLSKIREVITLAKYKMATKRYQPSLIMIPEEHLNSAYAEPVANTQNAQHVNASGNNKTDKKSCVGCPGCASDKNGPSSANCKNCGDKRNSIHKWLEGVSSPEHNVLSDEELAAQSIDSSNEISFGNSETDGPTSNAKMNDNNSSCSDSDTIKANSLGSKESKKRKAPPIPSTAPKIISHLRKPIRPQPDRPAPDVNPTSTKNTNAANSTNNKNILKSANGINQVKVQPPSLLLDKPDMYNNLSIVGSEIYNNPSFMLGSPQSSHRLKCNRTPSQSRQAFNKKRIDILDQYANPAQLMRENAMKNGAPNASDMMYEAISKDYMHRNGTPRDLYGHLNVPTPDYDDPSSTYSRKRFNNYENDETMIPPPDYNSNTLGRRQYQPDSPIYHRRSPHYLIVDYETDSLERTNTNKIIRNSFTPHSNHSSDMSSQPSPSLSSALPLEEEVEVGNTVYDRVEGFRKDAAMKVIRNFPKKPKPVAIYEDINSVSKAYMQSSRSSEQSREPRIKYNTPFHGSMTIEVDHDPTDDEISTDSDQFEPDTLDRKPKKYPNTTKMAASRFQDIPNNQRNVNEWPNRQLKQLDLAIKTKNMSNKEFIDSNMCSLPDMNHLQSHVDNQVVLRSSGSFKSNSLGNYLSDIGVLMNNNELERTFSSLREIYEAKSQKNQNVAKPPRAENGMDGRRLTLEARHSKRQRQTTLDKNMRKVLPPDIIPTDPNHIYDIPLNPDAIKSNDKNFNKNLTNGAGNERSNSFILSNNHVASSNTPLFNNKNIGSTNNTENLRRKVNKLESSDIEKRKASDCGTTDEEVNLTNESELSSCSNSESTELTGTSDNQLNSESNSLKQAYSQVRKTPKCSGVYNLEARRASEFPNIPKIAKINNSISNNGNISKCNDKLNDSNNNGNKNSNNNSNSSNSSPSYMNLSDVQCMRAEQQSDCASDSSTLKTGSTKFFYKSNLNQEANLSNHFGVNEDLDKIEILSAKSFGIKDIEISPEIIDNTKHLISELANDTSTFSPSTNQMNPTKVFHVDISPPTNGMQIALGIRDRVKKSKDFKYAWKKFVNMATSKFQGTPPATPANSIAGKSDARGEYDFIDKTTAFSDAGDRDDGIASLSTCDDSITTASSETKPPIEILSRSPSSTSSDLTQKNKSEMDYGYISADSNESKVLKKKLYARFNFKSDKTCPEPSTSKSAIGFDWRQKHLHRMQEIKENTECDRAAGTAASAKNSGAPVPKPKPIISNPILQNSLTTAKFIDFMPNALSIQQPDESGAGRMYSSTDDEQFSSGMSSESEGEYHADELCESGAESIETHSVLFKNIRKLNENN